MAGSVKGVVCVSGLSHDSLTETLTARLWLLLLLLRLADCTFWTQAALDKGIRTGWGGPKIEVDGQLQCVWLLFALLLLVVVW